MTAPGPETRTRTADAGGSVADATDETAKPPAADGADRPADAPQQQAQPETTVAGAPTAPGGGTGCGRICWSRRSTWPARSG
ncbi:hypothetical protein V2I01_27575 [Micromonospora sp. BRA006-A]|nr:hypothetical protein [Micromonospora sp. BRA006-A]